MSICTCLEPMRKLTTIMIQDRTKNLFVAQTIFPGVPSSISFVSLIARPSVLAHVSHYDFVLTTLCVKFSLRIDRPAISWQILKTQLCKTLHII